MMDNRNANLAGEDTFEASEAKYAKPIASTRAFRRQRSLVENWVEHPFSHRTVIRNAPIPKVDSKRGQHNLLEEKEAENEPDTDRDEEGEGERPLLPRNRFYSFLESQRISTRPFRVLGTNEADILRFKEGSFDIEDDEPDELLAIPILPADEMDNLTAEIKQWGRNRKFFNVTLAFVFLSEVALLVCSGFIIYHFHRDMGGSRYKNSTEITEEERDNGNMYFTMHITLQVVTLCLLSLALLIFRMLPHETHKLVTILHTGISVAAVATSSSAVAAAALRHEDFTQNETHLYTVHSWIGTITYGLFVISVFTGVYILYYPTTFIRRLHISFSISTFMVGGATAVTGLLVAAVFQLGAKYAKKEIEGTMVNVGAVMVLVMCNAVRLAVVTFIFRRRPKPQWDVVVFRSMGSLEDTYIKAHYMYDSYEAWVKEVNETKRGAIQAPSTTDYY